jgi:hypothetical protein
MAFNATTADHTYFWGAQVELGTVATSHIPTFAATVTRAADKPTRAVTAFPYSQTTGTLVTYCRPRIAAPATLDRVVSLNNGAASEFVELRRNAAPVGLDVVDGSTTLCDSNVTKSGTASTTVGNKWAGAWASADYAFVADGAAAVTDAVGAITGVVATNIEVGFVTVTANREFHGWFYTLRYLPRRMSNADMQTITT